ncbi:MAG: pyruvate formate-lyase [Ruminococcaceae bacterium]|nr:pyruvate formate-lyase [Oscillospiraceae bacterium]
MSYYDYIISREHRKLREPFMNGADLAEQFSHENLSLIERATRRFELLAKAQTPHIFDGQQIVFMRSTSTHPQILTAEEKAAMKEKYHIHELGEMSNLVPDYERILTRGLLAVREESNEYARREIDALIDLSDRYREEAIRIGRDDVAAVLDVVPRYPATNFREALQFFRIVNFAMRLEGVHHVTCGRFDKYMYPYYKADSEKYSQDELDALLRDFFISFNVDSDLYAGMQMGDNGQSLVLGGIDKDGNDIWNALSEACLRASAANKMIDPKINMRVTKDTPAERFTLGSRLTAIGLGFPQYSNDDVVVPGLEMHGYSHEDAVEYGVAACWEFIVPGKGCDVPNIDALSFPLIVDKVLHGGFAGCTSVDQLKSLVRGEIKARCDEIVNGKKELKIVPAPFYSLFFDAPNGDISDGSIYNNYGSHGTGLSTAADSLAVMEKYVLADKTLTADELIEAVDSDFEKHSEILPVLRNEAPKMGCDGGELADEWGVFLLDTFSECLAGRPNDRGGEWRCGTGSAMYYLFHADEIGASPDGRRKGEPLPTNYSPSLFAKTGGPVSVIRSFAKPDLAKTINGGPLTLEFDSSVFRSRSAENSGEISEESCEKLGALVKYYMNLGGHQLQLNAVSRDVLLDAQKNPDNYRQLIVRVWGWSGYFVELDKAYQDHVIARCEYTL